MNNKQKNRKNKTSKVYSLLPEYQYVTGINSLQDGGQAFGYEDFMTNQLLKAQNGTQIDKQYDCNGVPCNYEEYREHYKTLTGEYPPGDTDIIGGTPNPMAVECPEGQHWDATAEACVKKTIEVKGNKTVDNTSNDGTDKDKEKNPHNLPPWMMNTHSTAYNPYQGYNAGYPFQDEHSEAVNSMMDNSLLGGLFITANKLKGSGKAIKNALKNINPKTGKPYQHTDFGVSTLTNTTDKNVLLNQEGLDNLYDDKGRIIDENNTADKLFIDQNQAKANYFNQIADYHSNTFVDDQGNSRMSKQTMDADGNITYADIEEEVEVVNPNFNSELPEGPDNPMYIKETQTRAHTDDDLTAGDLAQEHIKDINVSRIQYNDDGSVKSMTRNTDEGKNVTVPYDKDADYNEGTNIEIINRQEEINKNRGNVGGSCASMNMCDDPNNPGECISCDEAQYGYELPRAQNGTEFCSNASIIDSGGKITFKCAPNKEFDSKHNFTLGAGMSMGVNNDGNYTGSFKGTGGYEWNPTMGTSGIKTYLGANYGARATEGDNNTASVDPFSNAVASLGWVNNIGGNSYNWRHPWQLEAGLFGEKDIMGNNPINFGAYGRLNMLNAAVKYNPSTNSWEKSIGFGFPIRQEGGDIKDELTEEFNTANVGHYVEPTHNTTEGIPYGGVSVASKNIHSATSRSNNDDETSYESDFIGNSNQAAASGADKVMVDRTWLGNLFNRSNVKPANINKKRHVKNIKERYGMNPEELLATGEWQLGPDGTMINTPYTTSHWSHSATKDNDMTFNEVFGTYVEPNEANNWQGGFSTSIIENQNMEFNPNDVNSYWENIGQYSSGDDNIYSDPKNAGSFLPEITVSPQRFGGALPKAQNGYTFNPETGGYTKSDVKDYSKAWGLKKKDTKHVLNEFVNQGVNFDTDTIISSVHPNLELGTQSSEDVTPNLVDNIANAGIGFTPWSFNPMGNQTQWTSDYPTYFPYGSGFVAMPKQYGGQIPTFQNGGASPQPSGKTYKIDGRIVSKEEYDNFVANGGTNATVDDENPNPINTVPVHNTDGSVDNVPLVDNTTPLANTSDNQMVNNEMVDADGDGISDFIDIDAGGGTSQPVDGVTPYTPPGPEAPVSFSYTDKPELTEEMMENMTDEQIEQYNKYRGREEKYNEVKAKYKTSGLGRVENALSTAIHKFMPGVDYLNQVGTAAKLAVDEQVVSNANDEYSDFNTAIEASRSDKGDFDVNTGVYRANTLGYGDGPRGQIAQMGAETGSKPAPDYTYLKQFLDASIVSYDPSFLMTQARDGEEIDADMELIKQLMAAGADFEII